MRLGLTLCLLAGLADAQPKPKPAAAAPSPVVVFPLAVDSPDDAALGLVIPLWTMERTAVAKRFIGPHVKQVLGMAGHEGVDPARFREPSVAARSALLLGADSHVFGALTRGPKGLTLTATGVRGAKTRSLTLALPAGADAAIATAAQALAELLFEVNGEKKPTTKAEPFAASSDAALAAADGVARVLRQPMGIETPALLDGPELERAIAACTRALALDPANGPARAALGLAEAILGDGAKAVEALKPFDAAKADLSLYWIARFWLVTRHQSPEAGQAVLTEALERQPGFLLGRSYLGELLTALGKHELAQHAFEAYLALLPREPFVQARVAKALARQGKHDDAIALTQKALTIAPDSPELQLQLASRYIDAGKLTEARATLEPLVKGAGARGEVLVRFGYVAFKLGQLDDAQARLQEGIDRATSPGEWRTRGRGQYDLALVAAKRGNADAAQVALGKAWAQGFRLAKVDASLDAAAKALEAADLKRTQAKQPSALTPSLLPKEATLFPLGPDEGADLTAKPKPEGFDDFRSPFASGAAPARP